MSTTHIIPPPDSAVCDTCGNRYDKTFTIARGDTVRVFDSFECAIESMAPSCAHCGCRILGHGVESDTALYCCAHCAREQGEHGVADREHGPAGAQSTG